MQNLNKLIKLIIILYDKIKIKKIYKIIIYFIKIF